MSKYLVDCRKCTNKAVNAVGEEWCNPMINGIKAIYIVDGETGKDFVFDCKQYSEDASKTILKM